MQSFKDDKKRILSVFYLCSIMHIIVFVATIIDINTKTKFICDSKLTSIDYPFGGAVVDNMKLVNRLIKNFVKIKNKKFRECRVMLFCRGSSGAYIAALFAAKLLADTEIIYVRKEGEQRHGTENFVLRDTDLIVFVDDFVCTGETMRALYKDIQPRLKRQNREIVDFICVTGLVALKDLDFNVKHIICKEQA